MKLTVATEIVLAMITNAGQISSLIREAREAGKDEVDDAQMDGIVSTDDTAMANLRAAIDVARSEGR